MPITPLETIPVQTILAGEPHTLDLSLFYVSDECQFDVEAATPLAVEWTDRERGLLALTAPAETTGIANLRVTTRRRGGDETVTADIPVRFRAQRFHEFQLRPEGEVRSLHVAGDFNGWSASGTEMTDDDGDGVYSARVPLEPGTHMYKFVLNGEWMTDPENPQRSSDGYDNAIIEIGGAAGAEPPRFIRQQVEVTPGRCSMVFRLTSEAISPDGPARVMAYLDNALAGDSEERGSGVHLQGSGGNVTVTVTIPEAPEAESLRLIGVTGGGALSPIEMVLLNGGRPVGVENRPETTWRDTVLYYVVVDRFKNGDPANDGPVMDVPELSQRANWQGGDLRGVLETIESGYFDELGVNCLWLSPLNRQPASAEVEYSPPNRTYSGYHGYWPTREDEIDPRFGTSDDLRAVVVAAHRRGIRVILDYVAAHVHESHPLFAAHRDWFGEVELPDGRMNIKLFDEFRLTTWFDTFLPRFDFENSREALEHMTDNAVWWMTEFGLDGFRQDATKHIPHAFWRTLTRKLRLQVEIPRGRRIFQVGETISGRDLVLEYARGGELDGQFDFPLYWPTRTVLGAGRDAMSDLANAMQQSIDFYGPEPMISALIGNHDVSRFMAYADGDLDGTMSADEERDFGFENDVQADTPEAFERAALAFAFLLTQPEIPMIYYGDEAGITGALDPDNRRMMIFDGLPESQSRLRTTVSQLARLRHDHPAFWNGGFLTLSVDSEMWIYARVNFDEIVIVALNRALEGFNASITLPETLLVRSGAPITDLLTGEASEVGEGRSVSLVLPPLGFRVLRIAR